MSEQDLAGLTKRGRAKVAAPRKGPAAPPANVQALGRLPAGKMNKTESRYAERLEQLRLTGEVVWWKFEAVTLKLAHDTRLTVDFFVMLRSGELQAHDVKGSEAMVTDDAKVKMKVAAGMFPWAFFYCYPRGRTGYDWTVVEVKA